MLKFIFFVLMNDIIFLFFNIKKKIKIIYKKNKIFVIYYSDTE